MERITRTKAIRLKCLDCTCNQQGEVRKCPTTNCPLWRYRMGREENDELKPVREKRKKSDKILDENLE